MDVAEGFDENGDPIFDGICDIRVDIFDDEFYDYFWNVWNTDKRLVQLRFILS